MFLAAEEHTSTTNAALLDSGLQTRCCLIRGVKDAQLREILVNSAQGRARAHASTCALCMLEYF